MTSSYTQQTKKAGGNEPWRNKERHYCALCNAWMGSDRQSISLHENGKKHREALEDDLVRRRDEKARKEKDRKDLESVYAKVNAAAGVDLAVVPAFGPTRPWDYPPHGGLSSQGSGITAKAIPSALSSAKKESHAPREVEKVTSAEEAPSKPAFDPNVGHYDLEGTTYLEG